MRSCRECILDTRTPETPIPRRPLSIYMLGVTQGTALKMFKRDYPDLAHLLFEVPVLRDAVHRLAAC